MLKHLLALAALTLVVIAGRAADDKDSVESLVKNLSSKDESTKLNAALSLGKLGKPAVEPVTAALKDDDADVRYYAVWALGIIGPDARAKAPEVIKLLGDKNEQVRRKAAYALGRIAPEPKDALPILIKTLGDDNADVRASAADAAALYGIAAVPALIDALKSTEARVRTHAAHALGAVGPDAKDALEPLAALLKDKDNGVLVEAASALAKLGKVSLPVLTDALKSDNPTVRHQAVEAIGKVEGSDSINALVEALKSSQGDVRINAARILGGLRVNDKLVVLSLAEVLKKDKEDQARVQAVHALQLLGNNAKPAAAALTQALADSNQQVRQGALYALNACQVDPMKAAQEHFKSDDAKVRINVATMVVYNINNNHPEAIKILTAALDDKDADVARQAAFTLAQVRQAPGKTIDLLIEALKDKNANTRMQAVYGLTNVGNQGAKALSALISALKDENIDVRRQACHAIGQVGGDAKETKAALETALKDENSGIRQAALSAIWNRFQGDGLDYYVAALKDKDQGVRWNAVNFIGSGGKNPKEMVPLLLDLAKKDPDQNVRYYAVYGLQRFGADGIPALAELVNEKDGNVYQNAMYGLQNHRAKAKPAVAALIECLKSDDVTKRWLAAQTLGQIGPDAKDAIPALKKAAEDANEAVKNHAVQALQQIDKK